MHTIRSAAHLIVLDLFSNSSSWQEEGVVESPIINSRKQGRVCGYIRSPLDISRPGGIRPGLRGVHTPSPTFSTAPPEALRFLTFLHSSIIALKLVGCVYSFLTRSRWLRCAGTHRHHAIRRAATGRRTGRYAGHFLIPGCLSGNLACLRAPQGRGPKVFICTSLRKFFPLGPQAACDSSFVGLPAVKTPRYQFESPLPRICGPFSMKNLR